MLSLPATALAGVTAGDDVYELVDTKQAGFGGGPTADPGSDDQAKSGDLPFTGLDVAIVVLAGAALAGTGIAVRRSTRSD